MSVTIASLALDNFRSHTTLLLTLTSSQILITGPNGAGKTNILEACSMLGPGRGLRHKAAEHMLNHHNTTSSWEISADLSAHPNSPLNVSYIQGKVSRKFAGNALPQTTLNSILGVWWHTPLVDHLLQTPAARRQIIDRCASRLYPEHLSALSAYKHFSQERLGALTRKMPPMLLDTLEHRIIQLANTITQQRFATLCALKPFLDKTPLPKTSIAVEATSTLEKLWLDNPKAMTEHMASHLEKDRPRDGIYKRMHTSIQHAAFSFFFTQGRPLPFELCSTGQRKMCSLSFILASLQHRKQLLPHLPTVLLLDETFSHMDKTSCQSIVLSLQNLDTQTWCTAHNTAHIAYLPQSQHIDLSAT